MTNVEYLAHYRVHERSRKRIRPQWLPGKLVRVHKDGGAAIIPDSWDEERKKSGHLMMRKGEWRRVPLENHEYEVTQVPGTIHTFYDPREAELYVEKIRARRFTRDGKRITLLELYADTDQRTHEARKARAEELAEDLS